MQANFGATFSAVNTTRYDNMIQYQTPSFGGFQAGLGYSFNTDGPQNPTLKVGGTESKTNNKAWTAALRYANGPIAVGLSYDQSNADRDLVPAGVDRATIREWAIAGSYDFEVVKLYFAGGQARNRLINAQGYMRGIGGGTVIAKH